MPTPWPRPTTDGGGTSGVGPTPTAVPGGSLWNGHDSQVIGTHVNIDFETFDIGNGNPQPTPTTQAFQQQPTDYFVIRQVLENGGQNAAGFIPVGKTKPSGSQTITNLHFYFFVYGGYTLIANGHSGYTNSASMAMTLRVYGQDACKLYNNCPLIPGWGRRNTIRWEFGYSQASNLRNEGSGRTLGQGTTQQISWENYHPIAAAYHGMESNSTADTGNRIHIQTYGNRYFYISNAPPPCEPACPSICVGPPHTPPPPPGVEECPNGCSGGSWHTETDAVIRDWETVDAVAEANGFDVYDPAKYNVPSPDNDPTGDEFDICKGIVGATPCRLPVTSPDVAIVSWINRELIDLNPAGVNDALLEALEWPIDASRRRACITLLAFWMTGDPLLLNSAADREFAGKSLLMPGDDPPPSYLSDGDIADDKSRRMFNRFQVTVDNGHLINYVKDARPGYTHWPCGLEGTFPRRAISQAHELNNTIKETAAGVSLISQARINIEGWPIDGTVNKCNQRIVVCPIGPLPPSNPLICHTHCYSHLYALTGALTPWIWSVIRFDNTSGELVPEIRSVIHSDRFNSFSIYVDRNWQLTIDQPSDAVPFILSEDSYQLDPNSIP